MSRFSLLIWCILVASSASHIIQINSKSVQEIFNFLEESSKNFKLGEQKDVVVVLGGTGSGKSTLTLLLTGAKLISVETNAGSGEYVVKDENGLVSPPEQSTQSQTVIPNLKIDNETHTSYYDCAGFEDSRGVEFDLSVTYLVQKLFNFATSVKFIFTVPYSSVRIGGDRLDFKKLARHATALIKNIEKYQNSMSLVVTKVESKISNGQIVSDEKTIENIGLFLTQTKSDLNSEDPNVKVKVERFFDILLQKQDNKFNRIQIVRAPTEEGSFNEMQFPKQERQAIRTMVSNTLQFTPTNKEDYGFAISADSKLKVHELFPELERYLMDDVVNIGTQIRDFYSKQPTQTQDRRQLITNLITGNEKLSRANADDLDQFKQQLVDATSSLQIPISIENLERHIGFVHYFVSVSDGRLTNGFKISDGLKSVNEYMAATKEQYKLELVADLKTKLVEDLNNINTQIKTYYVQKENEISDVNMLHGKFVSEFNTLAGITTKEPEDFQRQLIEISNSLHIPISADTLKSLFEHIDLVRFVESLNNEASSVKILIENDLSPATQYLSAARDWYQFAINLHNELAQYKVQQNVGSFNTPALIENLNRFIAQNSDVPFKDTGIKEFVDRINSQINAGMDNINVNTVKFNSFKKLLEQSMLTPVAPACNGNELVVKGYNVKMSDVANAQCGANLIKVMAINRFIVDANINKPACQMQIIAPTWEVVGEHSLELNGLNGENFNTDPPGVGGGVNGNPGEPGRPGQQGGHFFGVGDQFINGQNLKVIANGGNGGNGQNGGNGGDGVDGLVEKHGKRLVTVRAATPSGNGGDGGCGGLGGLPGKFAVVGLKGASNVQFVGNSGQGGPPGFGGIAKQTDDLQNHFRPAFGKDGANCGSRQNPSESPVASRSQVTNEYKAYVREHLGNSVFESIIRKFIQDLENNNEVQSSYDIFSFTNEMLDLENQYWKLRNKFTFRPFYESILHRLNTYDKTLPEADTNRKVLSYLYAAALSQMNSNIANQKTILNLRDYLNEAQTHINDIRIIGREINIRNRQVEYTNSLYNKMDAAKDLINQKIFPQLDQNLARIEETFPTLVDETVEKKKQTQSQIEEYQRKLREMKRAMIGRKIFGGLKIVSSALSFFGPIGAGIGAVVGAGTSIAEAAFGKQMSPSTITQISSSLNSVIKALKYNNELFKQQLNDIENEMGSNEKFNGLKEKLQKIKSDVDKADKEGAFLPIFNARKQLQELLKTEGIKIAKENPQEPTITEIVGKVQDIASVVGMSMDLYNQIKASKERMREVADAINSLQKELVALDQYEAQIFDTMIPMFRMTENYLKSQSENSGSLVELDIKRWEIKNRLGDVKYMFGQMTAVSGTHDDFQHYFEKVQATMDILIDVYDRIESISEHIDFVDFISKIASNGQGITTDPQLMNTINRMDEIIQTNLVLEMHEFVIHAFKQHYFPFAPLFLDKFNLPPQLQFNDTEALKENAIRQIRDLNSGVIISDSTLGSKDINLFDDIQFDSNGSFSLLPPFYVWRNNDFKSEIQKLLRGEEILLNADVISGVDKNAIKFNRIGIHLKSASESIQSELNTLLQDFDLTMTMVGNNYYRCDKRVYHLPTDANIIIEQSMKQDADGNPIKQNNVYRKISESNYFLSPYGLWSMKLESERNNGALSKFENESIDIELVGRGQYLKNTESVSRDVCNNQFVVYGLESRINKDIAMN